jgi:DNA-binding NarL/FixJ family response regulator
MPESVKVALWEVHAGALVCLGRFSEAQNYLRLIRESSPELSSPLMGVIHAFILLGEGNFEAALSWATRGFDEAHGRLDSDGLRNFAYVAALCLTIAGRYREVQELIDTVFALGEPPIFPQHAHLGLLETASVVAVRRGQLSLGESLAHSVDNIPIPDGPLPGLSRAWAAGQIAAAHGRPQQAAELLWDASEKLWERGARFSAAMGYLSYLELVPDRAMLDRVSPKLNQVEGKFVQAHVAFVTANIARDPDALMRCVEDLRTTGRYGQAVAALNTAISLFRADNRIEDAQTASDLLSSLSVTLAVGSFDPNRFIAARAVLSDRELEIVDLVAEGLSNQQIATRLTLSVRTVESHVHRVMRKVGAENRRELKRAVEGYATS